MTQDPFDRLRDLNPVPDDHLPEPPMSMAERIMAARSGPGWRGAWPGWAVAATAAVLVAAVGGAWMLWLGPGEGPAAVATSSTSTTAPAPTSTSSSAVITTATEPSTTSTTAAEVPDLGGAGIVYFLVDDPTSYSGGPFLIPAERSFAVLSAPVTDPLATTLAFLLVGPRPGETDGVPAITTAIPSTTTLNGVAVVDGVAEIDLSPEFTSGGGSASMIGRVAQLAFTATRYPGVTGIRILIDGEPLTVLGGEGLVLDDPITRDGFDDLLPAILVEEPAYWAQAGNPLVARGTANVFEATVSLTLTDGEGLILWEGFTTASCGTGCRGDWEMTIPYEVDAAQLGSLIAWEASAEDGHPINVREHPVWLTPSGDDTASPGDDGITLPDPTTGATLAAGDWTVTEQSADIDTGVSRIHVAWPAVAGPEPAVAARVQTEIDGIVAGALLSFGETEATQMSEGVQPNEFGLGFEVRWFTGDYLSIVFDEYYAVATAAHPFGDRFVANFDLATGATLHTDDLLTAEGIARLAGRVEEEVAAEIGDASYCCDGDPTAQTAILPGGLLVALDELDGLPHVFGAIDVFTPWAELDGLLAPAGVEVRASAPACSAAAMTGPGPQQGLPPAVAALRDTIFGTVANCNWSVLQAIVPDAFTYSFGEGSDPIAYWADLEARGEEPLRYLAGLLDRPYGILQAGETRYYVWPSAATAASWDAVSPADREALRPLYGDDDFAGFADFGGYIGYRVGITEDGTWAFFVAGD